MAPTSVSAERAGPAARWAPSTSPCWGASAEATGRPPSAAGGATGGQTGSKLRNRRFENRIERKRPKFQKKTRNLNIRKVFLFDFFGGIRKRRSEEGGLIGLSHLERLREELLLSQRRRRQREQLRGESKEGATMSANHVSIPKEIASTSASAPHPRDIYCAPHPRDIYCAPHPRDIYCAPHPRDIRSRPTPPRYT
eukprot:1193223-Prorocentrum_minimum.AAC.1